MRYFIGYNLGVKNAQIVDELRHSISEKFLVKEALLIPPHLTLFYPFEMEVATVEILKKSLGQLAQGKSAFETKVTGFNHFGETVCFLDVEQSRDLFDLKEALVEMMKGQFQINEETRGKNAPHFHITLAYKDVTPETFKLIEEYLKTWSLPIDKLRIDAITLFGRREERWYVAGEFGMDF